MANILEIIFKGTNQTGAAAGDVKKNLDGIAQSAKGVGSAMDTAMGVLASTQLQRFSDTAGRFLSSMVKEAGAAQNTMAQLEAVIESTGGAAGLAASEVVDMADSFSRLSLFEDDAIAAGQTVLLQFTKIGKEVFPAATQAMLDMATRMKMDLPSAARLVGKAMEGEYASLTRFGIIFDDQTKKKLENLKELGDMVGVQEIILEKFNEKFGGAAEAAAETGAGAIENFKKALGEIPESMGLALLENEKFVFILEKLTDAVYGAIDAFEKMPEGLQIMIVSVIGLVALLGRLAPALISIKILLGGAGIGGLLAGLAAKFSFISAIVHGTFLSAVGAIGGAITAATLPIILLVAAIGTLVLAIVLLGPTASKTFMMIADIIAASLNRAGYELRKFWTNLVSTARQMASNVKSWFQTVGKGIVDGIWAGIQAGWTWLKTQISSNMTSLLAWVKTTLGIKSPSSVFAEQVGLPMAQGIQVGFARGLRLASPGISGALMPAPAYAGASQGRISGGATVNVYGELSPEAQRRMRRQAEDIAYNAVKITSRRRR